MMPVHQDQKRNERDMEEEISEAKNDIKRLLREKREKQERRLEMMRRRAERRKHEILDKILMIKSKYPSKLPCKKLQNLEFKCFGEFSHEEMIDFCDRNFPAKENIDENANCREEENFCFMCCDVQLKEFDDERNECEKMCDHEMIRREDERKIFKNNDERQEKNNKGYQKNYEVNQKISRKKQINENESCQEIGKKLKGVQ